MRQTPILWCALLATAGGHVVALRPFRPPVVAHRVACPAMAATVGATAEAADFEARRAAATSAASSDDPASLGQIVRCEGELLVLEPPVGVSPAPGTVVRFSGGGRGTVLFSRVGLSFAAQLDGPDAALGEAAARSGTNLTFAATVDGEWGGASSVRELLAQPSHDEVFADKVPQSRRAPISQPLHTGVLAIDSLAPIGRGQSMLILGPDSLPAAMGRSALARRLVDGVAKFAPEVHRVFVTSAERAAGVTAQRWAAGTRLVFAASDAEIVLAAQAACSIAQQAPGDSLVVLDDLEPFLRVWKASCTAAEALGKEVRAEEEGSQLRGFYSALTERAHRRIGGDTVTLIVVQPSPSIRAADAGKAAFTLADFEAAGFSQRALGRLCALDEKGIALTEAVLEKLAIPAPGSGHPRADGGRAAGQHVEELTSLVDGHIELSEPLAAAGRNPPVDPSQSLTRIGVGSTKLRPKATSAAMRAVTRALRLELASAADPVHCEPAQRRRAAACTRVLQQAELEPMGLGEQVALLFAATDGLLDRAVDVLGGAELDSLLDGLVGAVNAAAPDLLPKVTRSADLTDAQMETLRDAVKTYVAASTA